MQRTTIGVIAVVLLALGAAALVHGDEGASSACWRVGLVMAILWFAFPQLKDVPRWMSAVGGVALLLVLWRPKIILVLIPLALVLWILRPRASRVDPRRRN